MADRRRVEPGPQWRRLKAAVLRRRDVLAVIALGGALGSLARWAVSILLPHGPGAFAWATFVVNVTGSFLIGLLMVVVIEVAPPSRYLRPFLGVGVLGGYTTFSTAMLDTRALLVAGHPAAAGGYLFASTFASFAAVGAGLVLARVVLGSARERRIGRLDRRSRGAGAGQAGR